MKRSKFTEQQIAYAFKQAELGTPGRRGVQEDGNFGCNLLQLEEELRWIGAVRSTTVKTAERRKYQTQNAGS